MRDTPRVSSQAGVYVLLGNPVAHSLSPRMHRAAFRAMKLGAEYVAFQVEDLKRAVEGLRGLGIRGASVTIPFKESILALLDEVDEEARSLGAVNTVLNLGGRLKGYNTDWIGFTRALEGRLGIRGESFAILGAGGAARAAAYAVIRAGGRAVILNRDVQRAAKLARELGCGHEPLERLGELEAQVLVNTTPVGMSPKTQDSPVPREVLGRFQLVMDVIYNPLRTRLLREAEEQGASLVSGLEMFVEQGAEQIRIWTGMEPPLELMRKVVEKALGGSHAD